MTVYRYSTISDFYKCPRYYELKNILKVPVEGPESADLKYGSAIHLAIEDLFQGGNGIDVFNIYWNSFEGAPLKYSRGTWTSLAELGMVHIEKFKKYHLKHFKPFFIEQKGTIDYSYSEGCGSIEGTLDFAGTYKEVSSIIDWKTSARPYHKEKLDINEQLYIYAKMAQTKSFEPKQLVYVVFVKDPKDPRIQVITKELTIEKHNDMLDNVTDVCRVISETKRFTRNTNSCMMGEYKCDYFNTCYGTKK